MSVLFEIWGVGLSDWGLCQKCDAAQPTCDRCTAAGIGQECFYRERSPHKPPTLKDSATVSLDTSQISSPALSVASTAFSSPSSSSSRQYTFPVGTTGLPFPVNASDPSNVGSTNQLDVDQANTQIHDSSLDDLNTTL